MTALLKTLRQSLFLTGDEAAALVQISGPRYRGMECGDIVPSRRVVAKLLEVDAAITKRAAAVAEKAQPGQVVRLERFRSQKDFLKVHELSKQPHGLITALNVRVRMLLQLRGIECELHYHGDQHGE